MFRTLGKITMEVIAHQTKSQNFGKIQEFFPGTRCPNFGVRVNLLLTYEKFIFNKQN